MPVGSLVAPGSVPAEGVWHAQDVVVQMDDSQQGPSYAARHADVLVIGMALAFVMVILVVEMWMPVSRIRGLSVRDPDLEIAAMRPEKGGMQGCGDEEDEDDDDNENSGAEPWVL
ncbi:hypothetical protein VMCG_01976 [Cytospora schulzeri]|uniref:Uncharacterized protein n=1 Tax=Cytospora schulzeri TaxID=448051 RepID=A0A423X456_9PEZI|nr:hypothetical protein VMCG_01976 [Valsa malicola]